jgi:AcrR family transcriptional regulator
MAEVCAERGYAEATVAGVAKRAGVSSLTFYRQFADKRDCMLTAHRQLLGRLLEEVDRACAEESAGEAKVRAAIRTVLALCAADGPSAALLTVEILAVNSEGAKCHDAMVVAFARRMWAGYLTQDSPISAADWARIAGMLALIGKLVVADEAARLPGLEDDLVAMVSPQS